MDDEEFVCAYCGKVFKRDFGTSSRVYCSDICHRKCRVARNRAREKQRHATRRVQSAG